MNQVRRGDSCRLKGSKQGRALATSFLGPRLHTILSRTRSRVAASDKELSFVKF